MGKTAKAKITNIIYKAKACKVKWASHVSEKGQARKTGQTTRYIETRTGSEKGKLRCRLEPQLAKIELILYEKQINSVR